jgi:hypothetical protein
MPLARTSGAQQLSVHRPCLPFRPPQWLKTSLISARSIPEQLAAQQEAAHIEEEETGPPLGTKRQYLVVMRHGERLDEVDVAWRETAERPWDPPLSPKGEQQARDAAKRLKPFGFDRVIISPFRRWGHVPGSAPAAASHPLSSR